ncbi:MAG: DNA topology modulation protein FlaR [Lachnospiraceae bacterium]|nr:DNA topology modulation protein FlaR [Lachnospiraceae bacterium]
MKIHIIGGSGSGKTYLANKLANEHNIMHYDLDDIMWDNNSDTYGVKRSLEERKKLLNQILENENWIIEGVYYKWCKQCFADADKIYLLNVPRYKYRFRIIKRFILRKLNIEKGKKETLKSLVELLKWADNYQKEDMIEIRKLLETYSEKVIE